MATRSLGRLTLDLVAQIGGFEAGMDKASRKSRATMKDIEKHVNAAAKVLAGLGVAATGFSVELVRRSAGAAKELQNMSEIANATSREMQVLAFAGRDYNIEQEKISDVLKDVNDRVGDFLTTGAGPMADFFEKIAPQVGVTAEQFRGLSGPQALQLFISSLEKANLNQQEMTFFMEAIASDATALLPLFRDNGRELARFAARADELGTILSETEVDNLADVARQMDELGLVMDATGKRIAAGAAPAISDLMDMLQDDQTVQALQDLGAAMVAVFTSVVEGIREAVQFAQWAGEEIARIANGVSRDDMVGIEQQIETIERWMAGDSFAGGGRLRFFGKDGLVEYYDDQELEQMLSELVRARDDLQNRIQARGSLFGEGVAPPSPSAQSGPQAFSDPTMPMFNPYDAVPPVLQEWIDQQTELNTLADDYLAQTAETLALMGQEGELAQVLYDIDHGRFKGLSDDRQQSIIDAAKRIDAQREEIRLQEEMAEKVRESMEAASEYRRLVMSEEQLALEDLKARYEEVRQLVADGFLSPEEGAAATTKLKEDFDDVMDSMQERTDELSVYAKRAAENMQDAFAQFLFDPFEDGLDGMLENFGRIIQQMAAEATAAQVFEFIGGWGQENAGASGVTGLLADFAGFFDAGGTLGAGQWGIAGEKGPEVVHGPANILGRQATEGLMNLSQAKGASIGNITMSFPGVGNAREADAAAGAAGRRLLSTINNAQRYR